MVANAGLARAARPKPDCSATLRWIASCLSLAYAKTFQRQLGPNEFVELSLMQDWHFDAGTKAWSLVALVVPVSFGEFHFPASMP